MLCYIKDEDGLISIDDFKLVLEKFDESISHENLLDMFKKVDLDKDGVVNFGEFVILMNFQIEI